MPGLFQEPTPVRSEPPGRVVGVVVNAHLWQDLDYLWPEGLGEPCLGQRVRVPLGRGNRKVIGLVVDTFRQTGEFTHLKPVFEVIDPESLFDPVRWELGHWISRYYFAPLGMTLTAMIPSAVGRHAPRNETVVFLEKNPADWPHSLGAKQRSILDELLEARRQGVEPLSLENLLHHSGASRDTIKRLTGRGFIRTESREVRLQSPEGQNHEAEFSLNEDQTGVLEAFLPKLNGGFSATLLYGVTGSGKTEVYIQAIRKVIDAGKQAIVLTPEIALTTQTVQRLIARLPKVAVLHSGLTDAQRAFYFDQIRQGHACVVVGPRSAVFAPTNKLGLIIVDEEHEATYKQDTLPRYHGRDVAVKRASLEGVPILLGTATPSLESLYNVQQGRYARLNLPRRVRGLPMPKLEIVNLRHEIQAGRIELMGRTLTNRLAATLDRNEQVILLMNRRGYASYVFCPSCGWQMGCLHCSRSMVFHQATQLGMCHYCSLTAPLTERCPACDKKIILFGWGIQRIENELARKFPEALVARMDSDTMTSPTQFKKVFDEFREGKLDILLGTQMVAKGLDFPKVSLVGIISADTSMAISDFRASERTFQLIVQVAGRAGRADRPGEVIVQTVLEDEPAIIYASKHDYEGFARWEFPLREQAQLPPVTRMLRILVRHEKMEKAEDAATALMAELRKLFAPNEATLIGPQPAEIQKIRNHFRFNILLISPHSGLFQHRLGEQMARLNKLIPAEIILDMDPVHLL